MRRNLVVCYCQEGVDKAFSEFTCDSSSPYSLPFSGLRALLNSVGFYMADLLPLPCSPLLKVEHRSSFVGFCSHQASVCVLSSCDVLKYLVFLWPHSHSLSFGEFIPVIWKKKKQNTTRKLRIMLYLVDRTEDLKSRRQDLRSKGLFQRGRGEATLSSTLAWRSPWTEETDGLQAMGSQRVGHS